MPDPIIATDRLSDAHLTPVVLTPSQKLLAKHTTSDDLTWGQFGDRSVQQRDAVNPRARHLPGLGLGYRIRRTFARIFCGNKRNCNLAVEGFTMHTRDALHLLHGIGTDPEVKVEDMPRLDMCPLSGESEADCIQFLKLLGKMTESCVAASNYDKGAGDDNSPRLGLDSEALFEDGIAKLLANMGDAQKNTLAKGLNRIHRELEAAYSVGTGTDRNRDISKLLNGETTKRFHAFENACRKAGIVVELPPLGANLTISTADDLNVSRVKKTNDIAIQEKPPDPKSAEQVKRQNFTSTFSEDTFVQKSPAPIAKPKPVSTYSLGVETNIGSTDLLPTGKKVASKPQENQAVHHHKHRASPTPDETVAREKLDRIVQKRTQKKLRAMFKEKLGAVDAHIISKLSSDFVRHSLSSASPIVKNIMKVMGKLYECVQDNTYQKQFGEICESLADQLLEIQDSLANVVEAFNQENGGLPGLDRKDIVACASYAAAQLLLVKSNIRAEKLHEAMQTFFNYAARLESGQKAGPNAARDKVVKEVGTKFERQTAEKTADALLAMREAIDPAHTAQYLDTENAYKWTNPNKGDPTTAVYLQLCLADAYRTKLAKLLS